MPTKTIEHKTREIIDTLYNMQHSAETVLAVARTYAATGNLSAAARDNEVSFETVKYWKQKDWFNSILELCRQELQSKLDVKLTSLIDDVVEHIQDRLDNGDWNQRGTQRIPVNMKVLLQAISVLYDKRALIRGEPTSRIERVSTEQRLNKLSRRFAELPTKAQEFIVNNIDDDSEERVEH